jgi:hypothetical protein
MVINEIMHGPSKPNKQMNYFSKWSPRADQIFVLLIKM